jgi:hypothetical protein
MSGVQDVNTLTNDGDGIKVVILDNIQVYGEKDVVIFVPK